MSVEHVPGHQERVERLRATSPHPGALRSLSPLEGGLPCLERLEHCWHNGPFVYTMQGTGWKARFCCFCPAHQQDEYERVPPEGHGKGVPMNELVWRKKEAT